MYIVVKLDLDPVSEICAKIGVGLYLSMKLYLGRGHTNDHMLYLL